MNHAVQCEPVRDAAACADMLCGVHAGAEASIRFDTSHNEYEEVNWDAAGPCPEVDTTDDWPWPDTWSEDTDAPTAPGFANPALARLRASAEECEALAAPKIPEVRSLASLNVNPSDDRNELLRSRFLCRTGGMLLVGPTGIGKSAFVLQAALMWSVGRSHFGIEPRCPLRCLIVQAENDDGDLVEIREGVLLGMQHAGILSADEAEQAAGNVMVVRDVVSRGAQVGVMLGALLTRHPSDLVILDPAFSYLGGDASNAADVSFFLRQVINPVLLKHKVGIVIVHHTNKPLRGVEKTEWKAGDFAYLGSGSAEWANWARAVLVIRSIGSHFVFELRAPKRGGRLGWTDDAGTPVMEKVIRHSTKGICWVAASPDEAQAIMQREKATRAHYAEYLPAALSLAQQQVWTVSEFRQALSACTGMTAERSLSKLIALVGEHREIGRGRYNRGTQPIYLIGPRDAVNLEIEAQIPKGEVQGAR